MDSEPIRRYISGGVAGFLACARFRLTFFAMITSSLHYNASANRRSHISARGPYSP